MKLLHHPIPTHWQSNHSNVNTQDDVSDNGGGDAPPPSQRRRCAVNRVQILDKGWHKTSFAPVDNTYDNASVGPHNMPQHITAESNTVDYLDLFLDNNFVELLSSQASLRAEQEREDKPTLYYAEFIQASC